jgi:hypothetical protein
MAALHWPEHYQVCIQEACIELLLQKGHANRKNISYWLKHFHHYTRKAHWAESLQ